MKKMVLSLSLVICVLLTGCVAPLARKHHPTVILNSTWFAENKGMYFVIGDKLGDQILGKIKNQDQEIEIRLQMAPTDTTIFIFFEPNQVNAKQQILGNWDAWLNGKKFTVTTVDCVYTNDKGNIRFTDGEKITFYKQ